MGVSAKISPHALVAECLVAVGQARDVSRETIDKLSHEPAMRNDPLLALFQQFNASTDLLTEVAALLAATANSLVDAQSPFPVERMERLENRIVLRVEEGARAGLLASAHLLVREVRGLTVAAVAAALVLAFAAGRFL